MKLANLMTATAFGLTMALSGAALAQQSQGQAPSVPQTAPSDAKSEADKMMRDKAGTGAAGVTGTTGTTGTATGTDTTTPPATTGTAATTESQKWYSGMRVDELVGKTVRNQADEDVGEIEKIVLDSENEPHAVLSVGGFLGIGDKEVAIPLSRMQMGDEKVILLSTEDEEALKAMPAYDEGADAYKEAPGDQTLDM